MASRRTKRFRAVGTIGVGFLGAGARWSGDLVDLSSTGALVRGSLDLEPGTLGRIGFEMGHETARIVAVVCRVVDGIGVAFEFKNMGPHDRELLRRLLLRFSKPPST